MKRPKTLRRCSANDFVNLLAGIFAADPAPHPRVPTRIIGCKAPTGARSWCESDCYAGRVGAGWQCTMSPRHLPPHIAPVPELVDGIYVESCPYRKPSTKPGPAVPSGSWHVRLDGYEAEAVEWVEATTLALRHEDSPMGRVALGITSDDMSVVARDIDARWLHSMPRMDLDTRRNLWATESQWRYAAHLKATARKADSPRVLTPAARPVLAYA